MTDYGQSDTSTTSLGANQFPISEVYVPSGAQTSASGGALTALEGGPASTDSASPAKRSAPASMYVKDGNDVAQGLTTDAAVTGDNPGTLSAKLRGLSKIFNDIWDSVNHRIKVDGSGVTQPVSGVAATSGGSTPYHLISAATTNATSLKGSAGQVYGLSISNTNAAARFFKLFDKASAPTLGTDTPKMTVQVPANATVLRAFPVGLVFSTGIAFAATGAMADADSTAIGAGDLSIDVDYK